MPNSNEYDIKIATLTGENAQSQNVSHVSHHKARAHGRQEQTPFAEKIKSECCEGSAIGPSLYHDSIEIIEDTGFWEPNRALNQRVSRFWETARPHSFGAIAMFRQESGEYWQGKPQNPRNSKAKYEAPFGNGSRAYLPAIDPETRKAIARRYGVEVPLEGSFWNWLYYHPSIPVIFTEGGKKALALLTLGYVAVALYGVNGGYRVNERIGATVLPMAKPELIADLTRFSVPGRPISLAFDQDQKLETRNKVAGALFKFGALLKAAGCDVSIASWEASQGKGIDDLIVGQGAAAADTAIEEAISFNQWAIGRQLGWRVKRKPDLNIGDREFVEVAEGLPKDRDIAFYGGKGTGKSKAIAQLLDGQSWLSITSLVSLARGQAEGWSGAFINDGDRYGNKFLKDGRPVSGGSACAPSMLKVRAIDADVLVLDEVSAFLKFLLISSLCNKDGIRPLLLAEFERRVREAKQIIIADADLTEEAIAYIEAIRGTRFYLVRSERQPLRWSANIIEKRNEAIGEVVARAKNLPDGKMLYINSDEKATANALAARLEAGGIGALLITQETSGGEIESKFLASKGKDIPALYEDGIRAIISSPSVVQGFSIEHNTEWIDSVWGIYAGTSIAADAIAQAIDRVRSSAPRYLFIAKRGRACSKLSRALNGGEFIRDFKSANTSTARLARLSLKPETNAVVDGLDWQSENIKLLASFEVSRNKGMIALRDTVCALLRHEGKSIKPFSSQLSKAEIREEAALLKEYARAAKREREARIASAAILDDEEAKELEKKSRKEQLTQAELHSLEKHYLAKFYRLESVERDDVRFDADGKTRQQIKNLEAALSDGIALDRTVKSIDATPTTPQDWDKARLRRWLLVESGAIEFIQGIVDGSIVDLTEEIYKPIAGLLKTHATEFRIAFGFGNLGRVSDFQAIATLLDHYGLKRTCCKIRIEGACIRQYSIDEEHLGKLKSIMDRRSPGEAPPQTIQLNGGGASLQNSPDIDGWLSPESLKEVRQWHEQADNCPKIRELLSEVPQEVLEMAIAS